MKELYKNTFDQISAGESFRERVTARLLAGAAVRTLPKSEERHSRPRTFLARLARSLFAQPAFAAAVVCLFLLPAVLYALLSEPLQPKNDGISSEQENITCSLTELKEDYQVLFPVGIFSPQAEAAASVTLLFSEGDAVQATVKVTEGDNWLEMSVSLKPSHILPDYNSVTDQSSVTQSGTSYFYEAGQNQSCVIAFSVDSYSYLIHFYIAHTTASDVMAALQ